MAEAAGLALGTIALAGVFKDCIDLFSYFYLCQSFERDYGVIIAKLDLQKTLLLQWADRVRLLDVNYDPRLDHPRTAPSVSYVLASIRGLLSESSSLQGKYGLTSEQRWQELHTHGNTSADTAVVPATVSRGRMERLSEKFKALTIRADKAARTRPVSKFGKLRWIITDKVNFEKLVQDLSDFISGLDKLVPSVGGIDQNDATRRMLEEDLETLRDLQSTGFLHEATVSGPFHVAEPTKERFVSVIQDHILEWIWFRAMDDRREEVNPAHHRTLNWVFRPSDHLGSVEWDDFSLWLRSNSSIYWVYGKAGSGKSTLVKYLYGHKDTIANLHNWSGAAKLVVGSFFFYNLGTLEQKSHIGISRAILYQILEQNRPLIQELLPRMWRGAYAMHRYDGNTRAELPSQAELSTAFEILSRLTTLKQRFCFFIDGLDEYAGNSSDGVAFIKRLSSNPNIKIVVSSRPIPVCVDAFSSMPKLRLQDLTKPDIENYIHDTLGSHVYMAGLRGSDQRAAADIIQQLINKATGVFLWVVLACRSILDGFASYDNIEELSHRIDELPSELEQLFRHIVRRLEPRYYEQTAKMLRICYQKQRLMRERVYGDIHGDTCTLTCAVCWLALDTAGLDFEKAPEFQRFSAEQQRNMLRTTKGRLRSRTGGLLEVRRTIYRPSVEFMHRAVFEFLDNFPEIWETEPLFIRDSKFNANAALLHMAMSICYERPTNVNKIEMVRGLCHAQVADKENPELSLAMLLRIEEVVLCREAVLSSNLSGCFRGVELKPSNYVATYGRGIFLLELAIEAGLLEYVRRRLSSHYITNQLKSMLLRHLYSGIFIPESVAARPRSITRSIEELLR